MGHFCKWYLTLSFLHSQCAMTALNDVRQYLSVEGGQVAVSYFELLKKLKINSHILFKGLFNKCYVTPPPLPHTPTPI